MTQRQRRAQHPIERRGLSAPRRRQLLVTLLGVSCAGPTVRAQEPVTLPAWVFSVGQVGAVGVTGRLWRVAADGTVSRANTFNHSEDGPAASARLSPAQMSQLSQALAEAGLDSLPAELRLSVHANPVITTLQWGERRVRLMSPSGQVPTLAAFPEAPDEVRRFLRLQTVLREVLGAALP